MIDIDRLCLGAHVSISGGLHKAFERAKYVNCNTMQIFTKNNAKWYSNPIGKDEIAKYKNEEKKSKITPVIAHASYLINLAAKDDETLTKSIVSFEDELTRCNNLGIKILVIHPGSHGGFGVNKGISKIIESVNKAIKNIKNLDVTIAFETTAGQGTSIGSCFEELQMIIKGIHKEVKTKVCIDSAHIFESGYKIAELSDYKNTKRAINKTIGIDNIAVIHLNDSKTDFGSRVDRHEHIGKGKIGIKAFSYIVNDEDFINIPKIIETPKSDDLHEDIENLNMLRSLLKG